MLRTAESAGYMHLSVGCFYLIHINFDRKVLLTAIVVDFFSWMGQGVTLYNSTSLPFLSPEFLNTYHIAHNVAAMGTSRSIYQSA